MAVGVNKPAAGTDARLESVMAYVRWANSSEATPIKRLLTFTIGEREGYRCPTVSCDPNVGGLWTALGQHDSVVQQQEKDSRILNPDLESRSVSVADKPVVRVVGGGTLWLLPTGMMRQARRRRGGFREAGQRVRAA